MTWKYLNKIRRTFPNLSDKFRNKYIVIANLISKVPAAERIRNKISFHFDEAEMLKMVNNISKNKN